MGVRPRRRAPTGFCVLRGARLKMVTEQSLLVCIHTRATESPLPEDLAANKKLLVLSARGGATGAGRLGSRS